MRTRRLVLAAFAVGIVISLLESVCTGQVYLPTIVYVLKDRGLAARPLACLVLYNLMFIMPLLAVFGLVFAGMTSTRLLTFSKRHLALSKTLLALLFLGLGLLLLTAAG